MTPKLLSAINIQAKREGYFLPVLRALVFEQLLSKFPEKNLLDVLTDHRGGNWGADQSVGLLPAPSLRSPDIRHGGIDFSLAEVRYYTPKELNRHRLADGDILVIKSNGSLDLVGKSQLYSTTDGDFPTTASNFVLIVRPDRTQVDPKYLDCFLKSPQALVWRVDKQRTTTGLRNLDTDGYLATRIPIPPSQEIQTEIVNLFDSISEGDWQENTHFDVDLAKKAKRVSDAFEKLESEARHQQSLLGKLKQAILQEAIHGKLTADWRANHSDLEPASKLLHRIQAEKARLIRARELRPEKPLPKISAAEVPFNIPNDWVWCRFGEVIRAYEAGSSFKCSDREVTGDEWGVIKTSAVTSGLFVENENKFLSSAPPSDTTAQVEIGDLIFCRANGSKGLAGMCVIVRQCSRNLLLSDKTIRVPLMEGINQEFIALHNSSTQSKDYFNDLSTGKSTSMNNVTRSDLFKKPIPLPPLAEQVAIVERVEVLMRYCNALAAEIEHNRKHAAHLLQAVLKEAFAPASS